MSSQPSPCSKPRTIAVLRASLWVLSQAGHRSTNRCSSAFRICAALKFTSADGRSLGWLTNPVVLTDVFTSWALLHHEP